MFCQKCGQKNTDGAAFCNNCGAELAPVKEMSSCVKEDDYRKFQKKLSSAHILNIVAAVVMLLCLGICLSLFNQDVFSSSSTSGNTTTTTSLSVGNFPNLLYIDCIVAAILFIIGLLIYKAHEVTKQRKLAVTYLIFSIPLCAFSVVASFMNSFATCGLSFLLLASGIMQIITGAKFYLAAKDYEG